MADHKVPLTPAQISRRHKKLQLEKAGAHKGIDAFVRHLMHQLPITDPQDLLHHAEVVKRSRFQIWTEADRKEARHDEDPDTWDFSLNDMS